MGDRARHARSGGARGPRRRGRARVRDARPEDARQGKRTLWGRAPGDRARDRAPRRVGRWAGTRDRPAGAGARGRRGGEPRARCARASRGSGVPILPRARWCTARSVRHHDRRRKCGAVALLRRRRAHGRHRRASRRGLESRAAAASGVRRLVHDRRCVGADVGDVGQQRILAGRARTRAGLGRAHVGRARRAAFVSAAPARPASPRDRDRRRRREHAGLDGGRVRAVRHGLGPCVASPFGGDCGRGPRHLVRSGRVAAPVPRLRGAGARPVRSARRGRGRRWVGRADGCVPVPRQRGAQGAPPRGDPHGGSDRCRGALSRARCRPSHRVRADRRGEHPHARACARRSDPPADRARTRSWDEPRTLPVRPACELGVRTVPERGRVGRRDRGGRVRVAVVDRTTHTRAARSAAGTVEQGRDSDRAPTTRSHRRVPLGPRGTRGCVLVRHRDLPRDHVLRVDRRRDDPVGASAGCEWTATGRTGPLALRRCQSRVGGE